VNDRDEERNRKKDQGNAQRAEHVVYNSTGFGASLTGAPCTKSSTEHLTDPDFLVPLHKFESSLRCLKKLLRFLNRHESLTLLLLPPRIGANLASRLHKQGVPSKPDRRQIVSPWL